MIRRPAMEQSVSIVCSTGVRRTVSLDRTSGDEWCLPRIVKMKLNQIISYQIIRTMAINEIKGIYYIGGDFNARIYNRREDEKEVIGPYIIEREEGYVANKMAPRSLESRSMFISNLKTHEHCAVNTTFKKPTEKLITYI